MKKLAQYSKYSIFFHNFYINFDRSFSEPRTSAFISSIVLRKRLWKETVTTSVGRRKNTRRPIRDLIFGSQKFKINLRRLESTSVATSLPSSVGIPGKTSISSYEHMFLI